MPDTDSYLLNITWHHDKVKVLLNVGLHSFFVYIYIKTFWPIFGTRIT